MNLLFRRCLPLMASAALTLVPLTAPGQDAASAKATFDTVNQHLDLGGQFYVFLNVEGDFKTLAEKGQEFYQGLQAGNDSMPKGLDIAALIDQLGMENLQAFGLSSIKFEKGYRNRFFAAVDGERQGLLRLSGGEPSPFVLGTFAPANAVYAFEMDVDLGAVGDLMRGIGGQLENALGMDPVSGVLQQPIPGTQLNVSQLLDALKGQMMAYVLVDEDRNLDIPDPNAPEIPGIDLVLTHSQGQEIFDHIRSFVTSNAPPQAYNITTENGVTQLKILLPQEATLGFYAPIIQMDTNRDQLLIGTRPEALATVTEGDRLASNPDFEHLAKVLPQSGNGYFFVSPRIYGLAQRFMDAASQGNNPAGEIQAEIMSLVYGEPQPMAGMWSNEAGGIYSESIAPMSYKASAAYMAVVPTAITAAVIGPMAARQRAMIQQQQQQRQQQDAQAQDAIEVR